MHELAAALEGQGELADASWIAAVEVPIYLATYLPTFDDIDFSFLDGEVRRVPLDTGVSEEVSDDDDSDDDYDYDDSDDASDYDDNQYHYLQ
jgi:hypothetical protein